MIKRVRDKILRRDQILFMYLACWQKILSDLIRFKVDRRGDLPMFAVAVSYNRLLPGTTSIHSYSELHFKVNLNMVKDLIQDLSVSDISCVFVHPHSEFRTNSKIFQRELRDARDILEDIDRAFKGNRSGVVIPYLVYFLVTGKRSPTRQQLLEGIDCERGHQIIGIVKNLLALGVICRTEINSVWFPSDCFQVHSQPEAGSFSYLPAVRYPDLANKLNLVERKLGKLRARVTTEEGV